MTTERKENISRVPFPREDELNHDFAPLPIPKTRDNTMSNYQEENEIFALPSEGWSEYDLDPTSLRTFILDEILTSGLDKLSAHLWLVATPRSDHISALHQQIVKGRQVTITESPELHLTWMYNHVYIKPLPELLLSWNFWASCLDEKSEASPLSSEERDLARASAVGFLRSYSHLILHKSDYRIAVECGLLSPHISYARIRRFLSHFRKQSDEAASKRFQYGELRLRRVNFWARFFLGRFVFQKVQVHYNYNAYFSRFYGPMLFIFAFFSTTLSAMQVELAANSWPEELPPSMVVFVAVCKWFSISTVIIATSLVAGLCLLLVYMVLRELIFAVRSIFRKSRAKGTQNSGGA